MNLKICSYDFSATDMWSARFITFFLNVVDPRMLCRAASVERFQITLPLHRLNRSVSLRSYTDHGLRLGLHEAGGGDQSVVASAAEEETRS